MTTRLTTNYNALKEELKFLTPEDLYDFEKMANVLSFQEVCTYLCVTEADIPASELVIAKAAHARGVVSAIHEAADRLFSNMNTRTGAVAALEYLRATSGLFQVTATPLPGNSGGFSFTVNLKQDSTASDAPKANHLRPVS